VSLLSDVREKFNMLSRPPSAQSSSTNGGFWNSRTGNALVNFQKSVPGQVATGLKNTFVDLPVNTGKKIGNWAINNATEKSPTKLASSFLKAGIPQNLAKIEGSLLAVTTPAGVGNTLAYGATKTGLDALLSQKGTANNRLTKSIQATVSDLPTVLAKGGLYSITNKLTGALMPEAGFIKRATVAGLSNVGEDVLTSKVLGWDPNMEPSDYIASFLTPGVMMAGSKALEPLAKEILSLGRTFSDVVSAKGIDANRLLNVLSQPLKQKTIKLDSPVGATSITTPDYIRKISLSMLRGDVPQGFKEELQNKQISDLVLQDLRGLQKELGAITPGAKIGGEGMPKEQINSLAEAPESVDASMKLLPAGEPKVYTPAQAKDIFKKSKTNKVVPFMKKLPSGDSVLTIPPGGVTGKEVYKEGKLITKSEANAIANWEKEAGVKAYKGGVVSKEFPAESLSSGKVTDKAPLSYQRESLLRNLEETFGRGTTETKKIKEYFYKPIIDNETKSVEFQNGLRSDLADTFSKMGIKKGSKEDLAAADFIEGSISADGLKARFPQKYKNIIVASERGRAVYKNLLNKINETIAPFGYSPIPERQNYVTHTQQISQLSNKFGSLLNFRKEKLPTEMAAINMDTKPGRQFFKFGLQRQGGSTHEGLITALDKYINPAANQIFHTQDIQRGRALVDYLGKSATPQNKKLSNFTSYLGQYTDSLAGKQNVIDRPFEKVFGRKMLDLGAWAKKRTGANMVGANVSSALTNYIPLTQSLATTKKPAAIKGLWEGLLSPFAPVDEIGGVKSNYLTRNFPQDTMLPNTKEKLIKTSGALFSSIDKFTKKSVIAGKYFEGLSNGLSSQDAMKAADEYGARVLVDRSYGQTPLIFGSKTLSMFTQFQTEVNNQMSFLLKDVPKNLGYNKAQIASALTQFVVLSYVFNNLFEKVTGRRPQLDVLHSGLSLANKLIEGAPAEQILDPTNQNTPAGEIVQNLPFSSIFSGGRIPMGAAFPDVVGLAKGTTTLGKEATKPLTYLLPGFGGGQARKTLTGLQAYNKGYSETPSGKVRYPIKQNLQNLARTALFGEYSTPEAGNYFNNFSSPLGDTSSQLYKSLENKDSLYGNLLTQKSSTWYDFLSKQSPEDANRVYEHLVATQPEMATQIKKQAIQSKLGLGKDESKMASLGVADGGRASAIAKKLNKMKTADEKNAYITKLQTAKIITKDVMLQLVQMRADGKI
jgi:hypothetical protein